MHTRTINYSQCWEDPDTLLDALSIRSDDTVLSITSGGDNTLALLTAGPEKVIAIDKNSVQNYLLELKIAAARSLSYAEYLEFLGVTTSRRRTILFQKVYSHLSVAAREWWSTKVSLIRRGIIHCGRFERFTTWFARYMLPFIHRGKTVQELLALRTIAAQRTFYRDRWNSRRWRFLLRLFSSRLILRRFARQPGMFTYAKRRAVANIYLKRLERHLTSVPIAGNFFLRYRLTGEYGDTLPPYLQEDSYSRLQKMTPSSLSIETNNLLDYLRSTPANTFSKYNLSDIFEALSPETNDTLWGEIIRTAKNGAVVAYWNNLVKRSYPSLLSVHIQTNEARARELHAKDRVFIYDSFHVHTIHK